MILNSSHGITMILQDLGINTDQLMFQNILPPKNLNQQTVQHLEANLESSWFTWRSIMTSMVLDSWNHFSTETWLPLPTNTTAILRGLTLSWVEWPLKEVAINLSWRPLSTRSPPSSTTSMKTIPPFMITQCQTQLPFQLQLETLNTLTGYRRVFPKMPVDLKKIQARRQALMMKHEHLCSVKNMNLLTI